MSGNNSSHQTKLKGNVFVFGWDRKERFNRKN